MNSSLQENPPVENEHPPDHPGSPLSGGEINPRFRESITDWYTRSREFIINTREGIDQLRIPKDYSDPLGVCEDLDMIRSMLGSGGSDPLVNIAAQISYERMILVTYFSGVLTLDEALGGLSLIYLYYLSLLERMGYEASDDDSSDDDTGTPESPPYGSSSADNGTEIVSMTITGSGSWTNDVLLAYFENILELSELREGFIFPVLQRAMEPDARGPSDSGSDILESSSEEDIPAADISNAPICNLCDHKIRVQFRGCSHAACTGCTKKLWWSRWKPNQSWPTWFPCPWCRSPVSEVGMLLRQQLGPCFGDKVEHEEVVFMVCTWKPLGKWMLGNSREAALRLQEGREDFC